MGIRITFLGAARSVTGSRYLVEANGRRVLVDCGFYQERELRERNWEPFAIPPQSIDAVLLTHAHLDHCGLLPRLVKSGFDGPVYCTSATADIAKIIMLDSAKIQEEDVAYKRKRHRKEGRTDSRPIEPLYTQSDAKRAARQLTATAYRKPLEVAPGIHASFYDSGHILGATSIVLEASHNGSTRRLLFSGDIGRWDVPLLKDPTLFDSADYVVMESTYGDRLHNDTAGINTALANVICETCDAGGNIVIPSFAVERSQEVLYRLHELRVAKRIPNIMVFLDSPMAVRVTEVFVRHPELFDAETMKHLKSGVHPCNFTGLQMTRSASQSKAINKIRGSAIIIAGSGMCTGGRIKHHLVHNLSRSESTVLFVGYQAKGTLGRELLTRPETVRIHGAPRPVRARIESLGGFSGHADQSELQRWISALKTPPRTVFATHGEIDAAQALQALIQDNPGFNVEIPKYRQSVDLE